MKRPVKLHNKTELNGKIVKDISYATNEDGLQSIELLFTDDTIFRVDVSENSLCAMSRQRDTILFEFLG